MRKPITIKLDPKTLGDVEYLVRTVKGATKTGIIEQAIRDHVAVRLDGAAPTVKGDAPSEFPDFATVEDLEAWNKRTRAHYAATLKRFF